MRRPASRHAPPNPSHISSWRTRPAPPGLHPSTAPPAAAHRSRQSVSQRLNHLLGEHLVAFVVWPQSHRTRIWYLTPKGARRTRDRPALRDRPPYPITSATAASLKTPHTLTVLRTHLAFVADARRPGDEHDHLDWTPEVSHE
ncbi:replication-relaxation family protein [Streptomyces sp. CA-142005]|uniref:replication-relaxation family protein n=1 Tax=Streptomyces sp. CA-142005 TaxID=3240052 RepID=UPI003D8C9699